MVRVPTCPTWTTCLVPSAKFGSVISWVGNGIVSTFETISSDNWIAGTSYVGAVSGTSVTISSVFSTGVSGSGPGSGVGCGTGSGWGTGSGSGIGLTGFVPTCTICGIAACSDSEMISDFSKIPPANVCLLSITRCPACPTWTVCLTPAAKLAS